MARVKREEEKEEEEVEEEEREEDDEEEFIRTMQFLASFLRLLPYRDLDQVLHSRMLSAIDSCFVIR